jgi:hypothetical protein
VKHAWNFFGKVIEKPAAAVTQATLSYGLRREINKQLLKAKNSISNSWVKNTMSLVWNHVSPQLPSWVSLVARAASPLADAGTNIVLTKLADKMVEVLDPLLNAPAAESFAHRVSNIVVGSTKWYIGHKIQYMLINYLAEKFKETEIETTLGYAKQADDYRVIAAIFTTILAANLLPYLIDKLSFNSEKDHMKAQLTKYVLSKSGINPESVNGQICAVALGATLDHLIATKRVDVNQIRIALASVQTSEAAINLIRR